MQTIVRTNVHGATTSVISLPGYISVPRETLFTWRITQLRDAS